MSVQLDYQIISQVASADWSNGAELSPYYWPGYFSFAGIVFSLHRWELVEEMGCDCVSVSRTVASKSKCPWFKSSHGQNFIRNLLPVNS